jgi:hypothetical protein
MLLSLDTNNTQVIEHYGKTVNIKNLQTTFYKRSKYKCSSTVLHFGLHKKPDNHFAVVKSKNHSEWRFIPFKSFKPAASAHQKKNIHKPNKNKKLTKAEHKQRFIQEDRQKWLAVINNPNYNPFSPLEEDEPKEEEPEDEAPEVIGITNNNETMTTD